MLLMMTQIGFAEGLGLGESKEELKLDYEVSIKDHGTGRVTVVFTLVDEGRLKPITSVDLSILSEKKHKGGGHMSDLSLSLATRKVDGRQVARIHLRKDLAEKAELHLTTGTLDGKRERMTWYFYAIPLADFMKGGEQKTKTRTKRKSVALKPVERGLTAQPASSVEPQ